VVLRLIFYLCVSIAAYFVALKIGVSYKYDDFKDCLALLVGVSGMVFTIMGIWIAFLYPNALSRIVSPGVVVTADFSESLSDAKRLENIVGAVLTSALVMMAALLVTVAKMLFFFAPIYIEYRLQLKAAALSVLICMLLVQFEAVIHVMLANIMFINDLYWKRQERKSEEEL